MKQIFKLFAFAFAALFATQSAADNHLRIFAMGDSLMAAHRISGRSISGSIGDELGVKVKDRSVLGARIIYKLPLSGSLGLNIGKQFRRGDWDWVVVNGGGNDLWLGCGCRSCERKMNKLIARDGSKGAIPKMLRKLRQTGAKVVYVGYLRSPGVGSPIEQCKDEGDELESRIQAFADTDEGVYFQSLADLVPFGDRSYHGADMIHPSLKASREIGQMVAQTITSQQVQPLSEVDFASALK